jgi:hypothetical protein
LPESDQPFGGTGPRVEPFPAILRSDHTTTEEVSIRPLAAATSTIWLGSDVKQLIVHLPPTAPHGRLWVWWEGQPRNDSQGGTDLHFCVGATSPGAIRWPDEFRAALINTSSGPESFHVEFITRTDKCTQRKHPKPPPPTHRSCAGAPRTGFYRSADAALPYVSFTVDCASGRKFIAAISGFSTCSGQLGGAYVGLGPDTLQLGPGGPGDVHGSSLDLRYHYEGGAFDVAGSFRADSISGFLTYSNPAFCSFANQLWSASWQSR